MAAIPECIAALPIRLVEKDKVLIEEGKTCESLFFLQKGLLQITKQQIEIAKIADAGAVFGEMSYLLNKPATASVVAFEDSIVYAVDDPMDFLHHHADAMFYVASILAGRLDGMNRYLVDVKRQFEDYDDHLSMLDEVLDTLMSSHPRHIERRKPGGA